ncbi:MAG: hypothetical protein ACKV2T_42265 [Kofleriaceae bacterium]
MRALLALVIGVSATTAGAAPVVDWETGRVVETGVGLADRQAPNPAVARGPARRKAEDAARGALHKAVRALPVAGGGTVKDKLGDAAIAARIDRAIGAALTVSATPETDGAWTVTLAVPIEALRQALADGPRVLAKDGDTGPGVMVVEGASKATAAIGTTIGGTSAPIVWVKKLPTWAEKAPRIQARGAKPGAIDADTKGATPSTLFVVMP